MERLARAQKELRLIEEFEREQAQSIAKIRDEEERREQEVRFIQNAIQPLLQEKDKTKFLIESIAPHLLY